MWIEGNFKVRSAPFAGWFRRFRSRYQDLFRHELDARAFGVLMKRLELLTGKPAITLNEFIGHFILIYTETAGSFKPGTEPGPVVDFPGDFRNDAYFFEAIPGRKKSYNQLPLNMPAGDLLRDWGVIHSDEDVETWNSTTLYPFSQPEAVRLRARDCDFYKYRGRGLTPIRHRTGYAQYVDPVLNPASTSQLTHAELDAVFLKPAVYCGVFYNFISDPFWAAKAIPPMISGDFTHYPLYIAGKTNTDYQKLFVKRCQIMKLALRGAGLE